MSNNLAPDSAEHLAGVREGQILVGKYRVERVVGVGGMGAVVAAHHLQLDTRVAIKFLLPRTLGNEEAVARFAREARAALKLSNEHVARVFEVGTLVSGAPFMVMEYLEGTDLGEVVRQQGPLSVTEATDLVLQACEAMAEAHSLDIVHRDLKPTNLFCTRRADGRKVIKVLDFGISKVTNVSSPDRTPAQNTALIGTPSYMSPEQLEAAQSVDARSDIWSLGVILYELLTGRVPFGGSTLPEVTVKIAARTPQPPLLALRPDVPRGLDEAIRRCLEKSRDDRFPTVSDLAVALLPFCSDRGKISVERIADVVPPSIPRSTLPSPPSIDESSVPTIRPSTRASAWESAIEAGEAAASESARPWESSRIEDVVSVETAPSWLLPPSAGALGAAPAAAPVATTPSAAPALAATAPPPAPIEAFSRSTPSGAFALARTAEPPAHPARSSASWNILLVAAMLAVATISVVTMMSTRPAAVEHAAIPPTVAEDMAAKDVPVESAGVVEGAPSVAAATFRPDPSSVNRAPPKSVPRAKAHSGEATAPLPQAFASHADTKADCDPNFYFDAEGRKHFRQECFVAAAVAAGAAPTAAAKADCDPSFYFDEFGRKHFKPQCFLNSKR